MQKIILSKLQKKILLDHTHKEDPNESCAILYGNKNGEENIVKEIWLTENINSSPVEFTLSPEQTWEMDKKSKELNLEIGEYEYLCIVHPWMTSTLVIEAPKEATKIIIPEGAAIPEDGKIFYNPEAINI